jgi:hypothetical protein
MDKKKARQELQTLRDSITEVLSEKTSEDISEHIEQAQESAREGAKALKKSLIDRIKDLPVVTQVSQLGAAGTVAVSTAAVTQVDIAKDRTEIFVAEVAQDVVEERFEVPQFIDNFVDFASLNNWGQEVIAEKISEAQAFVSEASELPQTSTPSSEIEDTKSDTSSSSQDTSSDTPSEAEAQESEAETKAEEQETKEDKSSKAEDSEESEQTKQEQDQEQKAENTEESQETSSDNETQTKEVNNQLPIIETPFDADDQTIRQVSPTS